MSAQEKLVTNERMKMEKKELIADMAIMLAKILDFINSGKRSDLMIQNFRQACQYMLENRLGKSSVFTSEDQSVGEADESRTARGHKTFKSEEDTPGSRRDAVAVALMGVGISGREAVEIDVADSGSQLDVVTVRSRSEPFQQVELSAAHAPLLEKWLEVRGNAQGPLLYPVARAGHVQRRRLTPSALSQIMMRANNPCSGT